MRPRHVAVAVACLGAALLLPAAGPATARGATCQGQPVTTTGTPGGTVTGTPGPDVIVTNGADVVNACARAANGSGGVDRCRAEVEHGCES
jgi:FtsP/CotA-like multicopper oxidase with cupredoxin domain